MARDWLRKQSALARPWPQLAMGAGAVQGVAIVLQSLLLALFLHGLIVERRGLPELMALWLGFPAAVALRALAGWVREEAGQRASAALRAALRLKLVDQLHRLGPAWRSGEQAGDLSSRLLEHVDALDAYVARYQPQQWLASFVPVLILFVAFPLSWVVGLIFLLTAPLVPIFMTLVGWGAKDQQTAQLKALSRLSAALLDRIRGLGPLRLLGALKREGELVKASAEEFRRRTMSVLRLAFLSSAVLEFLAALAIALTAVYLGYHLLGELDFGAWNARLTLGSALFLLFLAPEFYLPLRDLGAHYHAKAEAEAAAEQLEPLLSAESPQADGGSLRPAFTVAPSLEFRTLSFRYLDAVPLFEGFDLKLESGEAVALMGPSGSGKTSLLRLLLGRLRPDGGEILIGGAPLSSFDLGEWRESVAWMSQHPRLLAGTLAENLRIANQSAEEQALLEALDFAGLGTWFQRQKAGLATPLGEGGQPMSGGELRRLALARVRLRPSRVLLLDEPTASLDTETEELIISRVEELRQDRTTLILTHREAILRIVDRRVAKEMG